MLPKLTNMRSLFIGAFSLVLAAVAIPQVSIAASDQIKAVVNGTVITSGDVNKRVNFMKLRRAAGNLQKEAVQELVNEALMRTEIIRTGVSVSTEDVDAAFARFAKNNKMSVEQLTGILKQAGIGAEHFKAYVGVQMSWPRAVQARYGTGGTRMSNSQFVARLKQDNGQKPTTNEYYLQQMIFVVPEAKRNKIIGKRKSEAEASRKHYPGCEQAKVFAATMRDVSVRDIGRILEPQLPDQWKESLLKTAPGGTTPPQVTEKGVEYLVVCKKRAVSDDFAAQVMYEAKDLQKAEKDARDPDSQKYLEELRKNAQIETR